MAYLLSILFFVSLLWHFIYEAIIAPSLRVRLLYNYNKLRDELRMIKIVNPKDFSNELFLSFEKNIQNGIDCIGCLNIVSTYFLYKESRRDPANEVSAKHKMDLVMECKIKDVKAIESAIIRNYKKCIKINSGAWLPYIIILIIPYLIFLVFKILTYETVKTIVYSSKFDLKVSHKSVDLELVYNMKNKFNILAN